MVVLPPDLARLGDDLAAAARRAAARRQRRRRAAVSIALGALVFAALTPAALDPAQRELAITGSAAQLGPPGCEYPRRERFATAACERSKILDRPAAWPSYS